MHATAELWVNAHVSQWAVCVQLTAHFFLRLTTFSIILTICEAIDTSQNMSWSVICIASTKNSSESNTIACMPSCWAQATVFYRTPSTMLCKPVVDGEFPHFVLYTLCLQKSTKKRKPRSKTLRGSCFLTRTAVYLIQCQCDAISSHPTLNL